MDIPPRISYRAPTIFWTRRAWWRLPLAAGSAVILGSLSGPFILSGGFGGWILWLFCAVAWPFVVCYITDRWYFILAPATSLVVAGSIEYANFEFYKTRSDNPWHYLKMNLDIAIGMAIFSLLTSLGVAYAIYSLRKT